MGAAADGRTAAQLANTPPLPPSRPPSSLPLSPSSLGQWYGKGRVHRLRPPNEWGAVGGGKRGTNKRGTNGWGTNG